MARAWTGVTGDGMELGTALKISAGAHGALMVWALAAGWFSSDFDDAMEVTEVTLISGEAFAARVEQSGGGTPAAPGAPLPPVVEPDPVVSDPAEPVPAPEVPFATDARELAETPGDTPTPAPRVAPRPADRPEPDVRVAPEVVEAAEPVEAQDVVDAAEVPEPTAPEAATTRIVTEATETGGADVIALAPTATPRPRVRPDRPEPTVEAPEPEPQPEPEEAPDVMEAAVASALADVLSGGGDPVADPGPPMTAGERDALRLAVQSCWVVDVGSEAADVTVVVGMSMSPEGTVIDGSLRMIEASGGSDAAIRTAFQSARRAVLRCQRDGYDLPSEKYAQWQEIEMVFNPSDMRVR
ncbi:MAG: hypothetical protein AAGB05_06645 [Pseudomonadota bacterium]